MSACAHCGNELGLSKGHSWATCVRNLRSQLPARTTETAVRLDVALGVLDDYGLRAEYEQTAEELLADARGQAAEDIAARSPSRTEREAG